MGDIIYPTTVSASRPLGPTNWGLHGPGRTPPSSGTDQPRSPWTGQDCLTSSGTDQPRSPWTGQDCLTSSGTDQPRSPWTRQDCLTSPGTDQPRSPWTRHDSSRPLGPTNRGLHGPGMTPHVLWDRPTAVSMDQAGLLTSPGTDQPRSPWTGQDCLTSSGTDQPRSPWTRQDSSRPLGPTNHGLHGPGRTASRPLGPTNRGLHGSGMTPHVPWDRPTTVSMDRA